MTLPRATLMPGRDKSLRQRHPWVFAGSIAKVDGAPGAGDTVALHAADGAFLALAAWSPKSSIRARVWSFDEREKIDPAFFARRVLAAVDARDGLLDAAHNSCRLIHATRALRAASPDEDRKKNHGLQRRAVINS